LSQRRREGLRSDVVREVLRIDGVDLVMWLEREPDGAPRQAVIARPSVGELRFRPNGDLRDTRGAHWSVEGELSVLGGRLQEGLLQTPDYPDALARVWSALLCPTSGEVLLSAARGYEFTDWGGQAHIGGGSHGSLHASDSLGALVLSGLDLPASPVKQWAIRDVAALILAHFGLTSPVG
ncbi:MAG: alkaline phosphatase family protein, partial [Solirubrobacteraceae bacterium]